MKNTSIVALQIQAAKILNLKLRWRNRKTESQIQWSSVFLPWLNTDFSYQFGFLCYVSTRLQPAIQAIWIQRIGSSAVQGRICAHFFVAKNMDYESNNYMDYVAYHPVAEDSQELQSQINMILRRDAEEEAPLLQEM